MHSTAAFTPLIVTVWVIICKTGSFIPAPTRKNRSTVDTKRA